MPERDRPPSIVTDREQLKRDLAQCLTELHDLDDAAEVLKEHSVLLVNNLADVHMRIEAVHAQLNRQDGVYR